MLAHVGATRIPGLRHITVFSSALDIRISATAGPAQILLQFTGTVTAMGSAMAGRPRVIVALPDWTEGSLVANWLSENQSEPVHRSTMEGAASEIRTRPFNLIIADASWAVSNVFQTPDRRCTRLPLTFSLAMQPIAEPRRWTGKRCI